MQERRERRRVVVARSALLLDLEQGEGPVGTDTEKDGKPDVAMTAEQRAAQTQLA